jgi:hypothetical protein
MLRTASRVLAGRPHVRIRAACLGATLLFVAAAALEVLWPEGEIAAGTAGAAVGTLPPPAAIPGGAETWLPIIHRRVLFEPAVPLPSRRVAKQSVDKVLAMLALRSITEVDGQLVAYISVKGFGMRCFRQGDGIEDLFKITRMARKAVEMEIAGERTELAL